MVPKSESDNALKYVYTCPENFELAQRVTIFAIWPVIPIAYKIGAIIVYQTLSDDMICIIVSKY